MKIFSGLIITLLSFSYSQVLSVNSKRIIDIQGEILTTDKLPIEGAVVKLVNSNLVDTTNAEGEYRLQDSFAASYSSFNQASGITYNGRYLGFTLNKSQDVIYSLYDLNGNLQHIEKFEKLKSGSYTFTPGGIPQMNQHKVYIAKLELNGQGHSVKIINVKSKSLIKLNESNIKSKKSYKKNHYSLKEQALDTLEVWYKGDLTTSVDVVNWVDSMPTIELGSFNLSGKITGEGVASDVVVIIPDLLSQYSITMTFDPGTGDYFGEVWLENKGEHRIHVIVFDGLGNLVAADSSQIGSTNSGDLIIPDIVFNPSVYPQLSIDSVTSSTIALNWLPYSGSNFSAYNVVENYTNFYGEQGYRIVSEINDLNKPYYESTNIPPRTTKIYRLETLLSNSPTIISDTIHVETLNRHGVDLDYDSLGLDYVALDWSSYNSSGFQSYQVIRHSTYHLTSPGVEIGSPINSVFDTKFLVDGLPTGEPIYFSVTTSLTEPYEQISSNLLTVFTGIRTGPVLSVSEVVIDTVVLNWTKHHGIDFSAYSVTKYQPNPYNVPGGSYQTILHIRDSTVNTYRAAINYGEENSFKVNLHVLYPNTTLESNVIDTIIPPP